MQVLQSSAVVVAVATLCFATACGPKTIKKTSVTTATTTTTVTARAKPLPPQPAIYVPQAGGPPEYEPRAIYTGVSGNVYSVTRWLTYGGESAKAEATWQFNDCSPTCAGGHTRNISATIVLSRRTPCKGVPAYASLEVMTSSDDSVLSAGHIEDLASLCTGG